ncbi:VOC family protein [Minwuia sp.]|uniref:VOC family protein n=1 Tax=Minwuia sp. TaxID=2493630 RepID=UPI003A9155DC
MRLRQIAFAARELAPAENALLSVLGLSTAFRDPGVGEFGLHNAVIPVGGDFLEIVAPTQENTAAGRYMDRRHGDTGYMAIFQTTDAQAIRDNADRLGIRRVWNTDHDDVTASHFHPVDMGGVITSVDSFPAAPDPDEEYCFWKWAGPDWKAHVDTSLTRRMTGVEFAHPDPARQASTWSSLLGVPARAVDDDGFDMAMSNGGQVRFRKTVGDEQPGMRELDFVMTNKTQSLQRAASLNLDCDADGFSLMQVRFNLTDV